VITPKDMTQGLCPGVVKGTPSRFREVPPSASLLPPKNLLAGSLTLALCFPALAVWQGLCSRKPKLNFPKGLESRK